MASVAPSALTFAQWRFVRRDCTREIGATGRVVFEVGRGAIVGGSWGDSGADIGASGADAGAFARRGLCALADAERRRSRRSSGRCVSEMSVAGSEAP